MYGTISDALEQAECRTIRLRQSRVNSRQRRDEIYRLRVV